MKNCTSFRDQFSEYLDGRLTGVAMQQVGAHLESCGACRQEFDGWKAMQQMLASAGPAKGSADLALRLRVALSQEQARTAQQSMDRLRVRWTNTFAPFLLRASAGFASAVLLVGTTAFLIGAFAATDAVEASGAAATSPRFLYSMIESTSLENGVDARIAELRQDSESGHTGGRTRVFTTDSSATPIVVEAYVNSAGRVYDYRIVSGGNDPGSRARVETLLLFSVFAPAQVFGEPVRGVAVMTFSGVSVLG